MRSTLSRSSATESRTASAGSVTSSAAMKENHEFEYGTEILAWEKNRAPFPVLGKGKAR